MKTSLAIKTIGFLACLAVSQSFCTKGWVKQKPIQTTEPLKTKAKTSKKQPLGKLIKKGQVGQIKLGMSYKQVNDLLDVECGENDYNEIYCLLQYSVGAVGFYFRGKSSPLYVIRIIYAKQFKTKKGIGVSSLYSEVRKAYPNSKVDYDFSLQPCIDVVDYDLNIRYILSFEKLANETNKNIIKKLMTEPVIDEDISFKDSPVSTLEIPATKAPLCYDRD